MYPPSIDTTLTEGERTAPFRLADPDLDPLPKVTRLLTSIGVNGWMDIEFGTWEIVATGRLPLTKD